MPTIPPAVTPPPALTPQRGDRTTFSARMDAFITWFVAVIVQLVALVTNCYNNAVIAYDSAVASAASAANAAASANVTVWVSGTVYSAGDCRWSPIDFLTYRRKTNGAGAIDPSLPAAAADWGLLFSGYVNLSQVQNQSLTAFTTAGTSTAYTLTTTLAQALTTDERFQITTHVASGANPTLNRDAKGAKAIKMYSRNSAALKVPAVLYAGRAYDIFYDGVDYVVVDADRFGIVAHFQYDGNAQVIRGSGGIASITRISVGVYFVLFADLMPDANYTFHGTANEDAAVPHFCNPTGPTTAGFTVKTYNSSGVAADCTYINGTVFR